MGKELIGIISGMAGKTVISHKLNTNPKDAAFPQIKTELSYDYEADSNFSEVSSNGGLTKREYFAAKALSAMAANIHNSVDMEVYAKKAVRVADTLIIELNKSEE